MKICHVIGQPGTGKTTLVVDLVRALCDAGCAVGTLKHSAHAHELDKPGKDSHRHREAGASPVAMVTRELAAVYISNPDEIKPEFLLQAFFSQKEVVLIEGWLSGPHLKIEIYRSLINPEPLFRKADGVRALVYEGDLPEDVRNKACEQQIPCIRRSDIPSMLQLIKTFPEQ